MQKLRNVRVAAPFLSGVFAIGIVPFAVAQDADSNSINLSVTQSLEYSDNPDFVADPDNAGFVATTRLGFSINRATRIQTFSLAGGGSFEAAPDGDTGFEDANVRFRYDRDTGNSRLGLTGNYRRTKLDDVFDVRVPTTDDALSDNINDVTDDTIVISDGTRTQRDLGLSFATGLEGPVTFRLNLSGRDISYDAASDNDLFDSQTRRASLTTAFRFDGTLTGRVTASRSEFDTEDPNDSDRTVTRYGVGLTKTISETLSLDTFVGYRDALSTQGGATTDNSGTEFSLGIDRTLRNGALGFDLGSLPTTAGRRSVASVSRSLTLANDADLTYGLGAIKSEGQSVAPLVNLSYARALKRSAISLAFSQEGRTNSDDDTVIVSTLAADYSRPLSDTTRFSASFDLLDEAALADDGEDRSRIQITAGVNTTINSISSVSANLSFTDTDIDGAASGEDQQRVGLRLGYRRSLTQDWSMVTSLEHSRLTSSSQADRRENAISIGLSRSFSSRY